MRSRLVCVSSSLATSPNEVFKLFRRYEHFALCDSNMHRQSLWPNALQSNIAFGITHRKQAWILDSWASGWRFPNALRHTFLPARWSNSVAFRQKFSFCTLSRVVTSLPQENSRTTLAHSLPSGAVGVARLAPPVFQDESWCCHGFTKVAGGSAPRCSDIASFSSFWRSWLGVHGVFVLCSQSFARPGHCGFGRCVGEATPRLGTEHSWKSKFRGSTSSKRAKHFSE